MPYRLLVLVLSLCLSFGCASGARRDGGRAGEPDVPVPSGSDAGPVDVPGHDAPLVDAPTEPFDAGNPLGVDAPRPTGSGASIEIYSGDGLMMPQGWPSGDQMKVLVLDAMGRPAEGVNVTWEVTSGGAAVTGDFATGVMGTSRTDASGIARAGVRGEFGSSMASVLPSTIRASIPAGSVDFHVLCAYSPMSSPPSSPAAYVMTPEARDFGVVAPGATLSSALVVQVVNMWGFDMGRGLPGVGVRFLPIDAATDDAPLVSCANASVGLRAGGTVYTDATGTARCDLRAPSTPGTYGVGVRVGGATDFVPFTLTVR